LFQFGGGKALVDAIVQSPLWKKLYWYLIAFAIAFWAFLFWLSFHFPELYSDQLR